MRISNEYNSCHLTHADQVNIPIFNGFLQIMRLHKSIPGYIIIKYMYLSYSLKPKLYGFQKISRWYFGGRN